MFLTPTKHLIRKNTKLFFDRTKQCKIYVSVQADGRGVHEREGLPSALVIESKSSEDGAGPGKH